MHAGVSDEIELYVRNGYPVLAADLIGYGEMKQAYKNWTVFDSNLGNYSYTHWFCPVLIGRSIVGIHASDIQQLVLFLKKQSNIKVDKIYALAKGNICPALIHAAAFENSFSKIVLIEPLVSFRSLVMNEFYIADYMLPIIPGALTAYDLPDLAATFVPNKLLMINVKNQLGNLASSKVLDKDISTIQLSYSRAGVEKNFSVRRIQPQENVDEVIINWLE